MGVSRCRVGFVDADGISHQVEVDAESLYEAVATAISEWREDELLGQMPSPMTEFTVSVVRPPTEHRLRLAQVLRWAQPSVIGGPAGIVKRERVRKLLGIDAQLGPGTSA